MRTYIVYKRPLRQTEHKSQRNICIPLSTKFFHMVKCKNKLPYHLEMRFRGSLPGGGGAPPPGPSPLSYYKIKKKTAIVLNNEFEGRSLGKDRAGQTPPAFSHGKI